MEQACSEDCLLWPLTQLMVSVNLLSAISNLSRQVSICHRIKLILSEPWSSQNTCQGTDTWRVLLMA